MKRIVIISLVFIIVYNYINELPHSTQHRPHALNYLARQVSALGGHNQVLLNNSSVEQQESTVKIVRYLSCILQILHFNQLSLRSKYLLLFLPLS